MKSLAVNAVPTKLPVVLARALPQSLARTWASAQRRPGVASDELALSLRTVAWPARRSVSFW